jgi:polar amino acid transport system substrate-binding protein
MIRILRLIGLLVLFSTSFGAVTAASAQAVAPEPAGQRTLTASVRVLPPFVEEKNGKFTGFSIDLWNAIAEKQNWKTEFKLAPNVKGQLADVESRAADVGVGAVSITAERTTRFDFSQPIMNSGLQILVRGERARPESTALTSILKLLFSPAMLVWIGIAILLSVIPAHVIWFFERDHDNGIIQDRAYFPGIFQAMYWGLSSIMGAAESVPRQIYARLFALLWTFASIVFVAFYTAQLTASLTVAQFKSEISGPEDLPGKKVGTVQASTSAAYLETTGAKVAAYPTIKAAYDALVEKKVDAVVYDAPVLQYMATREGAGEVRTIGPIFHTEDYGLVFHDGSPLRKKVDGTLLLLREDGTYDRLNEMYFGKK